MKNRLKSSRVGIYKGKVVPVCAICRRGIFHWITGTHMHEALFTRGNVQGDKTLLLAIMVRENCVLLHPGKCHDHAHTVTGREQCLNMLIEYEGETNVRNFLINMNNLMTTELAEERSRLLS